MVPGYYQPAVPRMVTVPKNPNHPRVKELPRLLMMMMADVAVAVAVVVVAVQYDQDHQLHQN